MKLFLGSFLVLMSIFTFSSIAQDINQEEMMKQWQTYMTPGPAHKMLAEMVGEWEGEISMWMDPSQPPQITRGTTKFESIMDGRYIVGHYSSVMMGMPFSGMDITGYDNALKVYQNVWIDNMGTGMMITEGTFDEKTMTLIYKGKMVAPTGAKVDVRTVLKVIDKNHSIFEMYSNMDGSESKSMEIKYTRKS